jgi:hypothetical protein
MSTSGGPSSSGSAALLGSVQYAPGTKASYTLTSGGSLAAIDSTHATVSFKATASGLGSTQVLVRLGAMVTVPATSGQIYWGVFTHGSTQIGNSQMMCLDATTGYDLWFCAAQIIAVSASTNYQWDFAACNVGATNATMYAHGYTGQPGGHDAGPLTMEVWAA